jgi:CBS-domain-containing membrane protein
MKTAMMRALRVRDVMTVDVVFLRTHFTLDEAWAVLHERGIRGAPVLDARGRLVGVLSKADLADPRHRPPSGPGTVEHAVTHVAYAVRASDPVMTAVRLMLDHDIHRALVVDDAGTLAGIVTPLDVLRALTRGEALVEQPDAPVEFVDLRGLAVRT